MVGIRYVVSLYQCSCCCATSELAVTVLLSGHLRETVTASLSVYVSLCAMLCVASYVTHHLYNLQVHTPSNTPVTPPNFPDTLASLAKMSTCDSSTSSSTSATLMSSQVTSRQNTVTSPPTVSSNINVVPPLSHHGH